MGNPNANIAIEQGANRLLLGYKAGFGTPLDWQTFLSAMSAGPNRVGFFDDFVGDAVDARWDEDLSTGATLAVQAAAGGTIRLSTDTDDDDHATLALGLHWLVSKGITVFEARVDCVTAITLRAVEIGVSDAVSETAGLAFSSHDATPVDVATDAAVVAINSDESVATWSALSVKGGGTPQRTDTGVAPVADTFNAVRIIIDASGNAYFYIDDVLVASHAAAVATTAVLTPWISLKSLSAAAKSIDVDYCGISGPR